MLKKLVKPTSGHFWEDSQRRLVYGSTNRIAKGCSTNGEQRTKGWGFFNKSMENEQECMLYAGPFLNECIICCCHQLDIRIQIPQLQNGPLHERLSRMLSGLQSQMLVFFILRLPGPRNERLTGSLPLQSADDKYGTTYPCV